MNGILVTDGIPTERNFRWIIIILSLFIPCMSRYWKRAARTVFLPQSVISWQSVVCSVFERLISPEGTFPAFGRSVVYRMGAFQSLALAAWKYGLPEGLTNGQVRSALSAVMRNMFSVDGNFDDKGFLALGFAGHQPDLANYYTNNGSLYMTSLVFLPLGLPADHPFWSDPAEEWTSQKAWAGKAFPIDGHQSLKK